jgi:hypothetical protein
MMIVNMGDNLLFRAVLHSVNNGDKVIAGRDLDDSG